MRMLAKVWLYVGLVKDLNRSTAELNLTATYVTALASEPNATEKNQNAFAIPFRFL